MSELPTTFGKYFLTEKLATGGMAEIYLAKLTGPGGFEKQLVIKQIHPRLSGERQFVDLFVHEAKTLVTLAHGNIVPVYELGVVGEIYFIAMEYIDGPTLYRLTERMIQRDERMPPAVAAWIAARILEGLDYAHRKGEGVIHRDLSPRNVMLSRDGEIKLVDFGIAMTLGDRAAGAGEDDAHQSAPTGSFPYMSPEQVRRETLTPQSDLFSLGVLLWEMLVGARLFARADADATLAAVTTSTIPKPSSRVPDIPARLDELVMRALERDRGARWDTAADMLGALHKYLYALDDVPSPRVVAALVARFCPPELRRAPTNLESLDALAGAATPSGPATKVAPRAPVIAGDATKVAPKKPRQQTFATHVELEHILDEPSTNPASPPSPSPTTTPTTAEPPTDDPDYQPLKLPALPVPGRTPPSIFLLILLGIGTIALGIGAVLVFQRGKKDVLATMVDAAPRAPIDAPKIADAAPIDAAIDAPPADAGSGSGAPIHDARPTVTDAHVTPNSPVRDAPAAQPHTGTATLKIGADPWGEITVDGVARGRTPAQLEVPAGHHVVEIIYRGDDPPRRQSFPIDVTANQTLPLQADFTK